MKRKHPSQDLPSEDFEIFDINQNLLDKEWLNQPRFFFRYARQLADARRDYEAAKANLKVVQADADKKERRKAQIKEQKMTEAAINQSVLRRPDYRDAEQAVFTAKHRVDVMEAVVNALDHRKKALENLVRLHGQNYFSKPTADDDNKDRMKEVEKKSIRRGRSK